MASNTVRTTSSPKKFMTVDASLNSFAFSLFEDRELSKFGKMKFEGNNIYEKTIDAGKKVNALMQTSNPGVMVIERPIFVKSPAVASGLSMSQGAIVSAAALAGIDKIFSVPPLTWQSYIGTKLLTAAEKKKIRTDNPKRTTSWYKKAERDARKQKTIRTVCKKFDVDIGDNDIADSMGIGIYCIDNWARVEYNDQ